MSDQPEITWRPTTTYIQILSQCVDCGRGVWWTRRELTITVPAGRDVTYRLLTTVDPAYPATDEPRCYECTVYRALPWWRRWLRRRRLRLDLNTEPQPPHDDYPVVIPTPMTVYVPDHEDETVGFRHPSARTRKDE